VAATMDLRGCGSFNLCLLHTSFLKSKVKVFIKIGGHLPKLS